MGAYIVNFVIYLLIQMDATGVYAVLDTYNTPQECIQRVEQLRATNTYFDVYCNQTRSYPHE